MTQQFPVIVITITYSVHNCTTHILMTESVKLSVVVMSMTRSKQSSEFVYQEIKKLYYKNHDSTLYTVHDNDMTIIM